MSDHDSAHAAGGVHEHEHHSHGKTYLMVFCALCVFTLMSILADAFHIPNKNVLRVIILTVATSKALCVMMYFMHLKFEGAWKYLLLAPTFILAFTIPFALAPDMGMSYYTRDVPQVYEQEAREARKAAEQDGHAPAAPSKH